MTQSKKHHAALFSAITAVSVTSNDPATYDRSRAVYIGTSQDLDFTFDGTNWIKFQGCVAGTILDIQVMGARKSSGSASPSAGDVVFLY